VSLGDAVGYCGFRFKDFYFVFQRQLLVFEIRRKA